MNNTIINEKSNEKVVAEKRATRLKKTILKSALAFGIMFGSIQSGFCMQKSIKNNSQQINSQSNNTKDIVISKKLARSSLPKAVLKAKPALLNIFEFLGPKQYSSLYAKTLQEQRCKPEYIQKIMNNITEPTFKGKQVSFNFTKGQYILPLEEDIILMVDKLVIIIPDHNANQAKLAIGQVDSILKQARAVGKPIHLKEVLIRNPQHQTLQVDKDFAKLIQFSTFPQITFEMGLPECKDMQWLKPLRGKNLKIIIQDNQENYYDIASKTHKCANLFICGPDLQDTSSLKILMCCFQLMYCFDQNIGINRTPALMPDKIMGFPSQLLLDITRLYFNYNNNQYGNTIDNRHVQNHEFLDDIYRLLMQEKIKDAYHFAIENIQDQSIQNRCQAELDKMNN